PDSSNRQYTLPDVSLIDRYADEPRKLRVAIVGAVISRIIAGALLPAKVPGIELTIFEKNSDVAANKRKGGTWFENIHPGVRCDVPAHVYQTSFEPNTQWSEEFAQGPELQDYWTDIARKYDVYKYLKLSHEVKDLIWDSEKSVWLVKVCNLQTSDSCVHEADFVLTANGRFNPWKLPNYPGIKEFKGLIRHTSHESMEFGPEVHRLWEDWEYEYLSDTGNRLLWYFGNGCTKMELDPNHDITSYLVNPASIDLKRLHEGWWSIP
ncbi:4-hydroxyacetophenone monooxygenase, partial [Colletotrichum tofieldiae]